VARREPGFLEIEEPGPGRAGREPASGAPPAAGTPRAQGGAARPPQGAAGQQGPQGQPGSPTAGSAEESGDSSPTAGPRPLTPPKPGTPPAARPPRLIGDRDWIIVVECVNGAALLHPSRQRFSTLTLAAARPGSNPLVQAVQQMVARRQALLRPGEARYRPQIRFTVHPDGLRAFHLAYPALEALRLPMVRQDVQ
jgi:hypothetical protein